MSTTDSEYFHVWQRVKQWPIEMRQDLATQILKSVEADLPPLRGEWNETKNGRRCDLIDKDIQGTLTETEKRELELLTHEMRVHRRRVAPIPMETPKQLHAQLLEMKHRQERPVHEET